MLMGVMQCNEALVRPSSALIRRATPACVESSTAHPGLHPCQLWGSREREHHMQQVQDVCCSNALQPGRPQMAGQIVGMRPARGACSAALYLTVALINVALVPAWGVWRKPCN